MLSPDNATDRAADLVSRASRAGADAADAVFAGGESRSVTVRLGALEDVDGSQGQAIGLRVFVGRRNASVTTDSLDPADLDTLAQRAVAMAREAPDDPYAGLAPEELLLRDPSPDLDLLDPADPDAAALKRRALEVEDAARAVAGVTNSSGASAYASRNVTALATSAGWARGYEGSRHGHSVTVLAGEGAGMQRDYAGHGARHLDDVESAAEIGARAGARAVARLNPGTLTSAAMPVVYDPRVAGGLIGHLLGAINGASIARGTSFLQDRLDEAVFAPGVVIETDPHRLRGARSRPHDAEGLPTTASRLVDEGRLTGWIMASASARQLGLRPTGHAVRGVGGAPGAGVGNLAVLPGGMSPDELMADITTGFYVTELIGQGADLVTGDYSRGASGFAIRGGQLAEAVSGLTVAGNLTAMFAGLTPADDLVRRTGFDAPTLRVDGCTVAGG